jgi:cytochrome P450
VSVSERRCPITTAGLGGSLTTTADVAPWDYFDRVREAGDVVWDEGLNAWLVSSYELVKDMTRRDHDLWQAPFVPDPEHPPLGLPLDEWTDFIGYGSALTMSMSEGPLHDHQHGWWMKTFSSRVMGVWRDTLIRPIVHERIDSFVARGTAELCTEFADLVAPRVVASVMDLPQDDDFLRRLSGLSHQRIVLKQRQAERELDPALWQASLAATREMHDLLSPYIDARRSGEGDDLISLVWRDPAAVFGTDDYTEQDVVALAESVWDGATGTTMYTTCNGLYLLLTDPSLRDDLRAGGEPAVANFVEEALRLYGPVMFRPRIAKRDTALGGTAIRAGDKVIAVIGAANRDPARYDRPAAVDLGRPSPRNHFGFYQGARSCPGQGLARVELEEIVTAVIDRMPDVRIDADAPPPRYRELLMRRWEPLNVAFTPGEPGHDSASPR